MSFFTNVHDFLKLFYDTIFPFTNDRIWIRINNQDPDGSRFATLTPNALLTFHCDLYLLSCDQRMESLSSMSPLSLCDLYLLSCDRRMESLSSMSPPPPCVTCISSPVTRGWRVCPLWAPTPPCVTCIYSPVIRGWKACPLWAPSLPCLTCISSPVSWGWKACPLWGPSLPCVTCISSPMIRGWKARPLWAPRPPQPLAPGGRHGL